MLHVAHSAVHSIMNVPSGPLGMVLVRTELGQLVMVPQQALAQVQAQAQAQAQSNISPRPVTPTTGASFRVAAPQVRLCTKHTKVHVQLNL